MGSFSRAKFPSDRWRGVGMGATEIQNLENVATLMVLQWLGYA